MAKFFKLSSLGRLARKPLEDSIRIASTNVKPGMILVGTEGVVLAKEAYPVLVTSVEPQPNGVKIFVEDSRGQTVTLGLLREDSVYFRRVAKV